MIPEGNSHSQEDPSKRRNRFQFPPELVQRDQEGSIKFESQNSVKEEGSQSQSQPFVQAKPKESEVKPKPDGGRRFNLDFLQPSEPISAPIVNPEDSKRGIQRNGDSRSNTNLSSFGGATVNLKREAPSFQAISREGPLSKVKTIPEKKPIEKKPETNKAKKTKKMGVSASEGKLKARNSLYGPEIVTNIELGYTVPFSIFRALFKEVINETYDKDSELRITTDSIHYLKIAAENFMVSKYRLASYITRARGRKTLNKIDLETLDLIQNDPFLRRKSCPQVMIT